ncbi:HNH endonuclease [Micromonospora tulbaghiae]|uniref:HNH endonuclease n=1 Tax=Micromonospora tulbaghiae TaxID=479978 RepID=UPI003441FD36
MPSQQQPIVNEAGGARLEITTGPAPNWTMVVKTKSETQRIPVATQDLREAHEAQQRGEIKYLCTHSAGVALYLYHHQLWMASAPYEGTWTNAQRDGEDPATVAAIKAGVDLIDDSHWQYRDFFGLDEAPFVHLMSQYRVAVSADVNQTWSLMEPNGKADLREPCIMRNLPDTVAGQLRGEIVYLCTYRFTKYGEEESNNFYLYRNRIWMASEPPFSPVVWTHEQITGGDPSILAAITAEADKEIDGSDPPCPFVYENPPVVKRQKSARIQLAGNDCDSWLLLLPTKDGGRRLPCAAHDVDTIRTARGDDAIIHLTTVDAPATAYYLYHNEIWSAVPETGGAWTRPQWHGEDETLTTFIRMAAESYDVGDRWRARDPFLLPGQLVVKRHKQARLEVSPKTPTQWVLVMPDDEYGARRMPCVPRGTNLVEAREVLEREEILYLGTEVTEKNRPRSYYLYRNTVWSTRPLPGESWEPAQAMDRTTLDAVAREAGRHDDKRWRERDPFVSDRLSPGRREAIPQKVKILVWQRDNGRCVECGSRERLEFDHIIPWADGGSNTFRNLQLLCESCNRKKGRSL